jgi:hypothetical protein
MKLKLYRFQHPKLADEYVPVISQLKPKEIRKYSGGWDHGGMNYEVYCECMEKGEAIEVKSLKKYPEMADIIPYNTDVDIGEIDINYVDCKIFFDEIYGKEYEEK